MLKLRSKRDVYQNRQDIRPKSPPRFFCQSLHQGAILR